MNVNVRAHISQQLLCLVTAGGHGAARRDPSRVFRVAPRARPRARRRERERAEARVARASFSRKWAETGGLSTMARTRVYITPHRIAPTDARKTATRDPECAHTRARDRHPAQTRRHALPSQAAASAAQRAVSSDGGLRRVRRHAVRGALTCHAGSTGSDEPRPAAGASSAALGSQPLPTALAPAEILSKRSLAKASAEHGEGGARGWPAKALTCSATAHASQATK